VNIWESIRKRPWIWLVALLVLFLALDAAFILIASQSPPEMVGG
jgi:hypothetical protein